MGARWGQGGEEIMQNPLLAPQGSSRLLAFRVACGRILIQDHTYTPNEENAGNHGEGMKKQRLL